MQLLGIIGILPLWQQIFLDENNPDKTQVLLCFDSIKFGLLSVKKNLKEKYMGDDESCWNRLNYVILLREGIERILGGFVFSLWTKELGLSYCYERRTCMWGQ